MTKQLQRLLAESKRVREAADAAPWAVIPRGDYASIQAACGLGVAIDLMPGDAEFIIFARNNLERMEQAAAAVPLLREIVRLHWYDAGDGGACLMCEANLHPNAMGKHSQLNGDPCEIQRAKDFLEALDE